MIPASVVARVPRRVIGYVRTALSVSGAASRAHGVSRPRALARARRLRRAHGFSLEESLALGLLDPAAPLPTALISKREASAVQRRLNPHALEPLTENKAVFAAVAAAHGLPVPETLALLSRTGPAGARPRAETVAAWTRVLAGLRMDVVVKPVHGWHGEGVRILRHAADGLRVEGGGTTTPGALAEELWDEGVGAWLVQPRLHNAGELAAIGRPGALHTLRVVTLCGPGGEARVLYAALRIAVSSPVANFRGGTRGNLHVDLDDRGVLRAAWRPGSHGAGLEPATHDPVSGRPLAGVVLPGWDEAVGVCRRAARAFLPMRCIGWDVALTPAGPVLIEANAWWDNAPTMALRPQLAALQAVADGGTR